MRITDGGTFKGKAKATTEGTTSKPTNNQPLVKGAASISPQEPSVSAHPSQQQEDHLFGMLHEMKSR